MPETVRWYLEVVFLVVNCFALGAALMALVLHRVLPEADEPLNIVTFTEADGRTTLTVLVQTTSRELRDMIINSGMETGMQEAMDHLEQVAVSLRGARAQL